MDKKIADTFFKIVVIICILALIGLTVFSVIRNNKNGSDRYIEEQQQTNETSSSITVESDIITDIPNIKPNNSDKVEKPDIDVGEITRNPDAEVVDTQIEYETKEENRCVEE